MPIDTSIYQGIQPYKAPDQLNQLARVMQIQGVQRENQLGQMKMDEYQRGIEDQNALRSALSAPGADVGNALLKLGKVKEYNDYQKGQADITKSTSEASKFKADTATKKLGLYRDYMFNVGDAGTAAQLIQTMHQDPDLKGSGIDAVPIEKLLAQIPQDPAGFDAFKQKFAMGAEKFMADLRAREGQAITMRGQDLTADTTRRGQDMTDSRTRSEGAANRGVTLRGQQLADERAREFNATKVEENNIKRTEKKETADLTKNSQIASFDTMLGTLDRLSAHPGLHRSVGAIGAFPTMPGSDSANFQAELNTFQSQAFLPMVAQLKGMGALSDAEGKKLTAAVGALDPKMGEDAFRASVKRITDDMEAARERVAGARRTAAPAAPAAPAGNLSPAEQAELDALRKRFGK